MACALADVVVLSDFAGSGEGGFERGRVVGAFAVARNTLPLILFGAKEYGYYMGLLMVPQNIVNAAAPIIFAAAISRVHAAAALALAGFGAVTGFGAVLALVRACRGHGGVHPR